MTNPPVFSATRTPLPAPQTHAEVVNARIAAFPRAVQAVRNALTAVRVSREDPVLSEKDILRLAVELVR